MIYSQDQKDSIIYQSQVWMANMGVKLTSLEKAMQPCDDLYNSNYRVRTIMTAIQKSSNTEALEEFEEEVLYTCLVEITGIKDYPVSIPLTIESAPAIIIGNPGPTGPSGANGADGTNANVQMVSLDDEIIITSAVDPTDPAKVQWFFKHDYYIEPAITLALDPSASVVELGNAPNITLNMVLAKGRDDVLTSEITSDGTLDASYQSILDLAALNAGGNGGRSVIESAVVATTTYTVNIKDGVPTTKTASKTVTFVYPFFFGNTDSDTPTFYSALTKLTEVQGTKVVLFDATDDYFWFGYPDTYPDLTSIKDQNGFEVLSGFVKSAELVTSTGLANNWVDQGYTFYRTIAKTTINGFYTFTF